MAMAHFSIGQLSLATQCKIETIRYYEKIGLLPAPGRTAGNQRRYDTSHHQRLLFILHAREMGFPIKAVRDLLALGAQPDAPCGAADSIAGRQLEAVRQRIRQLQLLEKTLESMRDNGGEHHLRDCRVMETLAACRHCYDRHHQF